MKKDTASGPAASGGTDYSHMRVEVTAADGRLLFIAMLLNHRGSTAELRMTSGGEVPKGIESLPVSIRGYHNEGKRAVSMQGRISSFTEDTWRVEQLTVTKKENDRAAFRMDTYLDATVTRVSGAGVGGWPCKVVNLSAGGARIASDQRYAEDDRLMLFMRLPDGQELSAVTCQVVRVFGKKNGRYEYGCQFLKLSESDEGKITKNLFALQRKMRTASM